MPTRSLHARIVLLMSVVFALVAGGFATAAWYYARLTADQAHDALLVSGAAQIAENMYVQGGVLTVEPPIAVIAGLSARDLVAYKVVDARGVVVAGNPDLPSPGGPHAATVLGDVELMHHAYRAATTFRLIQGGWASVTLAQTLRAREALAESLTGKAMVGILGMSVLGLGATLIAVKLALIPLARVEKAIAARDPQDLRPLELEAPPEIHTLLASINAFMARLDAHVRQMQRLIGDAAHQVRTPLAALAAQLDLMAVAPTEEARRQYLVRVQDRAAQLGRLAAQLFDHAMVVHRAGVVRFEPVDIVDLSRQVLLALAPLAGAIVLAFDAPEGPVIAAGDRVSLREALSNVVHNALRHGARRTVTLSVLCRDGMASIEVLDDGPGIPPGRWHHVRQAFHGRADDRLGAGLGLAIAEEVMRAHRGSLSFRSRSDEGFAVILSLPAQGGCA
ncbi:sensor histidine kinase [Limobrevibacterium gyesilva]|uniref:histidine kinase n=1 Tax=Limobrevibacterium gyesilva TaxID=2991712 RepID=A0AA42CIA4_9PROT|nr:sensor histidine kinase [Limobrevibacterium gyesilva]MCW3475685.1 sensor histidine kinase [Limobrevibacterium gyesilva]